MGLVHPQRGYRAGRALTFKNLRRSAPDAASAILQRGHCAARLTWRMPDEPQN
jgi:hypothetical protein